MNEKQEELISQFEKNNDPLFEYLDLAQIEWEEVSDYQDVLEQMEEQFNVEIIYYSNAIEYLKDNDPSLQDAFDEADQLGFEVSSLDSEILASLLASKIEREEFYELEDEIETLIEELEEAQDEEE